MITLIGSYGDCGPFLSSIERIIIQQERRQITVCDGRNDILLRLTVTYEAVNRLYFRML